MISRLVVAGESLYRIRKVVEKNLRQEKEVTLAYIGDLSRREPELYQSIRNAMHISPFNCFRIVFRHRTMSGLSKPESAEHLQNWE